MNRGAQLLREWLNRRKLTQKQLAARIAEMTNRPANQSTVSAWLHGSMPSVHYLFALQSCCGIAPTEWTQPPVERRRLARTGTEG